MTVKRGTLYLVSTPIGNLGDISTRALEVLASVGVIACEDTRTSGRLLQHFQISKRLVSYHDFNESDRAGQLVSMLMEGIDVAVISDAGSPGISDPAYRIVQAAIENSIDVIPIPGANAVIPALTASGLPTDRFFFDGFLPQKSGARKRRFQELAELTHTLVFYESPHRIAKSIADAAEVLGERQACLAREITKMHEEFIRGTLGELREITEKRSLKGEMVLVIHGAEKKREKTDKYKNLSEIEEEEDE